jgi:hypothetical protein
MEVGMVARLKVAPESVTALLWRRTPQPPVWVRRLRVAFGIVFLVLSAVVSALNVSPLLTVVAIGAATAALYGVIVWSGRLEIGQLLGRDSRVVLLVSEAQTSAGGRALFLEATKSLKIVAGWLGPGIFFNEEVFATCRRILARGGEVSIIVAEPNRTKDEIRERAHAPELWKEFEGWVKEGKVSLRKTTTPQPPHFAIVDNAHVWDEAPHDPAELGRSARVIYFDERVSIHNERFRQLQAQSVPF